MLSIDNVIFGYILMSAALTSEYDAYVMDKLDKLDNIFFLFFDCNICIYT